MFCRVLFSATFACCLLRGQDAVPAFRQGARILFQGDSITDGNRGRTADPNHILGHGYVFLIAAKYGAMLPERNLTFLNRGVSGNRVSDLAARWQKDTLELKPDLLSILIGINDSTRQVPLDEFEKGYDELLAATVAANPKVRLVLGEPFALPVGRRKENFDECLQARARRLLDLGRRAPHLLGTSIDGGRVGADRAGVLAEISYLFL